MCSEDPGRPEIGGVSRVSLLVVPDHHHRGLSMKRRFCGMAQRLLRTGERGGAARVLPPPENRITDGPLTRLIARSYTAGEGEFPGSGIFRGPATPRSRKGRGRGLRGQGRRVHRAGMAPWRGGRARRPRSGVRIHDADCAVSDFATGTVHRSRSQVWSVRAGWRRACSLAWNSLLFKKTLRSPLTRIGFIRRTGSTRGSGNRF